MAPVILHLRSETKPLEHRSALSPDAVKQLIRHGFTINVEKNPERIFDDSEFEQVGATLVEEGSWPKAPLDHIIIGLKELEDKDPFPLVIFRVLFDSEILLTKKTNVHIQFAHCYKQQAGWQDVLGRFPRGGGLLYDLEFLADANGRRVAAFGYHAGYAGAALALKSFGRSSPLTSQSPYPFKQELDEEVKQHIAQTSQERGGSKPTVLVIGALGRCGRGAVDMCRNAGIPNENIIKWDLAETAKGGPFEEIRSADIFINCIYLDKPIPKFVTTEFLQQGERRLSVVCDVSCDTTNPHNPIPFADQATYFDKPTYNIAGFDNPNLQIITIDHLPSLLPREASEAFSEALLPSLLQLQERDTAPVWIGAEKLFNEKVALLPEQLKQREDPATNGK